MSEVLLSRMTKSNKVTSHYEHVVIAALVGQASFPLPHVHKQRRKELCRKFVAGTSVVRVVTSRGSRVARGPPAINYRRS